MNDRNKSTAHTTMNSKFLTWARRTNEFSSSKKISIIRFTRYCKLPPMQKLQRSPSRVSLSFSSHTPAVQAVVLQAKHVGGNHIDVPLELGKGQSAFPLDTLKRSLRYSLHNLGNI